MLIVYIERQLFVIGRVHMKLEYRISNERRTTTVQYY